jgi:hypothetical protein
VDFDIHGVPGTPVDMEGQLWSENWPAVLESAAGFGSLLLC